jgi:type VI secretion system secreted protein VgrG
MAYTQTERLIAISTPLGEDVLLLRSLQGVEAISQLFQFNLDLLSTDGSIDLEKMAGANATVRLRLANNQERFWNGYLSSFTQEGLLGEFACYRAQFVPWLWFLSRTADCRIFQDKTVPQIIEQIFTDLKFQDFELRLYSDYEPRGYCVQYRETDLNFVSRLIEQEGICYFFEHTKDKHVLVLTDKPKGHPKCVEPSKVRWRQEGGGPLEEDVVVDWSKQQELRTGKYAHTDYNFETPSTSLAAQVSGKTPYEFYDYPGEYPTRGRGDVLARIRLEEHEMQRVVVRGASYTRSFAAGHRFDLEEHYRTTVNGEYVLTAVRHSASAAGDYVTEIGGVAAETGYENSFECIPSAVPFRPVRLTPQPFVQGCQTAVVVGPSGKEIYTDEYGRIKVQFHWDREGKKDQNSSCWMRVSTPWAGSGWGAVHIPRIGQEVIVSFLEGDPDRPIVTGSVYNAEQMPPFGLPDGAVISGVKSDSTLGHGGYNQISLDDTKGNELIHVHAQYDQDIKVEHDERTNVGNDRTESVGHDEKISIGNDRTEDVGHDEKITIGNNRTESVGVDESITIGSNRTEKVGANETIDIGSNRTETVGSNEMITVALTRTRNVGVNEMVNVGGAQEITIGGLQALTVGITRAKNIGTSESVDIGTNQSIQIGSNQNLKVGSNRNTSIDKDDKLQVGKNLLITAGDQILLKTGSSSILMKKDGTVQIQCKDLTIKASGKINVKASGKITMKGQQILEN